MDDYQATMKGIYTTSVNEKTLDEAPMAYKSLEDIVSVIHETVDPFCRRQDCQREKCLCCHSLQSHCSPFLRPRKAAYDFWFCDTISGMLEGFFRLSPGVSTEPLRFRRSDSSFRRSPSTSHGCKASRICLEPLAEGRALLPGYCVRLPDRPCDAFCINTPRVPNAPRVVCSPSPS